MTSGPRPPASLYGPVGTPLPLHTLHSLFVLPPLFPCPSTVLSFLTMTVASDVCMLGRGVTWDDLSAPPSCLGLERGELLKAVDGDRRQEPGTLNANKAI